MPLPVILAPVLAKVTSFLSAQGAKVIAAAIAIIVVCILLFWCGRAVKNAAIYKEKYRQERIQRQAAEERYDAREQEIKRHDEENAMLLKKAYASAKEISNKLQQRNKDKDFDVVKANQEIHCLLNSKDESCTTHEK